MQSFRTSERSSRLPYFRLSLGCGKLSISISVRGERREKALILVIFFLKWKAYPQAWLSWVFKVFSLLNFTVLLAWENSRHFTMAPLISSRNDVWATSAENPLWWRVTTQIWVILLIGPIGRGIYLNYQKHYPNLSSDTISMECLLSFLRRYFAGKTVVMSRNIGSFVQAIF